MVRYSDELPPPWTLWFIDVSELDLARTWSGGISCDCGAGGSCVRIRGRRTRGMGEASPGWSLDCILRGLPGAEVAGEVRPESFDLVEDECELWEEPIESGDGFGVMRSSEFFRREKRLSEGPMIFLLQAVQAGQKKGKQEQNKYRRRRRRRRHRCCCR